MADPITVTKAQVDAALKELGIAPTADLDSVWIGCLASNAYLQVHRNNDQGATQSAQIPIEG